MTEYSLPGPDRGLRDVREISPFEDSTKEDEPGILLSCPSCGHAIIDSDLVLEGGGDCPGCQRNVRLYIASFDLYGEWRTVPADRQEDYR